MVSTRTFWLADTLRRFEKLQAQEVDLKAQLGGIRAVVTNNKAQCRMKVAVGEPL